MIFELIGLTVYDGPICAEIKADVISGVVKAYIVA
jgi:hypothetical protein